jgi:hypothetical protein
MKISEFKCQTELNRICFHWRINLRPQASDVKNTSTAPLCGYNRSVFDKAEFESTKSKSSAIPTIVWSFDQCDTRVQFFSLRWNLFSSILAYLLFVTENFSTASDDRVEILYFAAVYKVRGLVVRNAMHFLFLFINDVV